MLLTTEPSLQIPNFDVSRQDFLCETALAVLELALADQAGLELTELILKVCAPTTWL